MNDLDPMIDMKSKEKHITLNLVVDGNFSTELICTFNFDISGITHSLNITRKHPETDLDKINPLFRIKDSSRNNWEEVTKEPVIMKENIYVSPFSVYDFTVFNYQKITEPDKEYFLIEPVPNNNQIFSISSDSRIKKTECTGIIQPKRKFFFVFGEDYDPLLGIINEEWYPLIVDYGDKNEIFREITQNYIDSLFQKERNEYEKILYENFYYSYKEIQRLDEYHLNKRKDWSKFKKMFNQ